MDLKCLQTAVLKPKSLHGSSAQIYDLLVYKYEHSDILHLSEVVALWADIIVAKRRHGVQLYYNSVNRAWVYVDSSQVNVIKKDWSNPRYARPAIQWLKYHIGNLILNGYAVFVPIINFDASDALKLNT